MRQHKTITPDFYLFETKNIYVYIYIINPYILCEYVVLLNVFFYKLPTKLFWDLANC